MALRPALTALVVALLALAAAAGLAGPAAQPAGAHAGDGLTQPIFEVMSPAAPGVKVDVVYSANYQLLVSNTSPQPLTFLADSGEPFIEIGPDGVRGNFASPAFYDSNNPAGLVTYPPQAKPGPDVPPIWRKLAADPSWGWYDHRLHPTEQYVPIEIQRAKKVAVLGRWKVPLRYGDQPGELRGRFEFRPPTGSYRMVQTSSVTPSAGVTIQTVSASYVPAIFVKNESPDPVVVLGKRSEPFARIGPQVTEVNVKSPIWAEIQQAEGKDPSDETDPAAEPKWRKVADSPAWHWLEFRAAAPKTDPPAEIIERGRAVTVKEWSIPYVIGDRRMAIEGITEFVPIAQLRREVAGEDGGDSNVPLYAGSGLGVAVLGGGIWLLTSKRRGRRA